MAKYLLYDDQSDSVNIQDNKPVEFTKGVKGMGAVWSEVSLWYRPTSSVTEKQVKEAYMVFITSHNNSLLLQDVNRATQAILKDGHQSKSGYIAVGASVKLVKWRLRDLNVPVVSLNVSGVKPKAKPTTAFSDYLERKLKKLDTVLGQPPYTYYMLDYVDTGGALYQLKRDVQQLRPDSKVFTIAVAAGAELTSSKNVEYKNDLQLIVDNVPKLQDMLYHQATKDMLGRRTEKNPYDKWSEEQHVKPASTQAKYAENKPLYKQAIKKGQMVAIDQDIMIELLETENPPGSEDYEDEDVSYETSGSPLTFSGEW